MTRLEPFFRRTCGYIGRGVQIPCPQCGKHWVNCKWTQIRPEDDLRALMQQTRESIRFLHDRLRKAEEKVATAEKDIILATRNLLNPTDLFRFSPDTWRMRLENAQKRLETWSLRRDRLQRRTSAIDANGGEAETDMGKSSSSDTT